MKRKANLSLAELFTRIFILVFVLFFTVLTLVISTVNYYQVLNQLKNKQQLQSEIIPLMLSKPLWDFNDVYLKDICLAILTDEDFVRFRLQDSKGKVIDQNYCNKSSPHDSASESFLTHDTNTGVLVVKGKVVMKNNQLEETIATYQLWISKDRAIRAFQETCLLFSAISLIALGLVVILLSKILQKYVISPIEDLKLAAENIAQGHLEIELKGAGAEELAELWKHLDLMREAIRQQLLNVKDSEIRYKNMTTQLKQRVLEQTAQMQTSHEFLTNILQHAPIGIITLNPKGDVISVNVELMRMFDYQEQSPLGLNIFDLPFLENVFKDKMREALAGQKEIVPLLSYRSHITGVQRHLHVIAQPLIKDGQVFTVIVLLRDISEQVMFENELRQKHDKLQEAFSALKSTQNQLEATEKIAALTKTFEQFVPRQFLQRISEEGLSVIKSGSYSEENMTILFSDIRSFTTLSETMSPKETFDFLNAYLQHMEKPITKNQGFIDKFIGDAIMALFDGENAAQNAVNCAVDMQMELQEFNAQRAINQQKAIRIGIGIHTGTVMIGVLGTPVHMDSTVIGDDVNLASRIETITKIYDSRILISANTLQCLIKEHHLIREIDTVRVRGKKNPTTIYEVFDADQEEIKLMKIKEQPYLLKGMALFKIKDFEEAIYCFEECLKIFPKDVVATEYIKRCYYYNKYPPQEIDWKGVAEETNYLINTSHKRKVPRFALSTPINVYLRNSEYHLAAHCLNISMMGVQLGAGFEVKENDQMLLEIYFPQESLDDFIQQVPLRLLGQVAWVKKEVNSEIKVEASIGVEYILLSHDLEQILMTNLMRLNGIGPKIIN